MEFIIDNWFLVLACLAVTALVILDVRQFFKKPSAEQMDSVREWLLWAVAAAEQEMGGGAGQLKLRQTYDWFLERFPALALMISFEQYSGMVDDALDRLTDLLDKDEAARTLITGGRENG